MYCLAEGRVQQVGLSGRCRRGRSRTGSHPALPVLVLIPESIDHAAEAVQPVYWSPASPVLPFWLMYVRLIPVCGWSCSTTRTKPR